MEERRLCRLSFLDHGKLPRIIFKGHFKMAGQLGLYGSHHKFIIPATLLVNLHPFE